MNMHLRTQIDELLSRYQQVTLATCGPAGPQAGRVRSEIRNGHLVLKIDRTSDHLFNLEMQPDLTILTPDWELHGTGHILSAGANMFLPPWQTAIKVTPIRLHILDQDSLKRIETIDFPAPAAREDHTASPHTGD